MTKISVYLLTGFLGSGKTSLMKQLLKIFPPRKVAIIVNEFGKAGVDGTVLANSGYVVTEIDNGSIFCACQLPAFEKALADLQQREIDAIVVEASGLSDPTHVQRILGMPGFSERLSFAGTICLIDAKRFHRYVNTALVSEKQIMISDAFVINKADLVDEAQLAEVVEKLLSLRPDADYRVTVFGRVDAEIFEQLDTALSHKERLESAGQPLAATRKDLSLRKLALFIDPKQSRADLEQLLADFADETFRIKGLVQLSDGAWHVDAVGDDLNISTYPEASTENLLNILYNSSLACKEAVMKALAAQAQFNNQLVN